MGEEAQGSSCHRRRPFQDEPAIAAGMAASPVARVAPMAEMANSPERVETKPRQRAAKACRATEKAATKVAKRAVGLMATVENVEEQAVETR